MDFLPFCINAWSKHSLIILHKIEFLTERWIMRCWNLADSNNLILLYFTDSKNRRALKSNKWTRVGVPISVSYHSTMTLLWDASKGWFFVFTRLVHVVFHLNDRSIVISSDATVILLWCLHFYARDTWRIKVSDISRRSWFTYDILWNTTELPARIIDFYVFPCCIQAARFMALVAIK